MRKTFTPLGSRIFALVCTCLGGTGQGIVAPRMPDLLGAEGLAWESGLSAALMYLGIFVTTFFFGRIADRGKVHRLLGIGLAGYGLTLWGLALSPNHLTLYTFRFIEGVFLSAVFVASDFLLGRLSAPGERATWLSYYGVALSVGLLLGPLMSLGWQGAGLAWPELGPFALASGLAAILAILAFSRIRVDVAVESVKAEVIRVAAPVLELPSSLTFNPLLVAGVYGLMEASLVAILPILSRTELLIKPELGLVVIILAAAASAVPWGMLADRITPKPVVRWLLILLAVLPAALILVRASLGPSSPWMVYSSFVVFGVIAGGLSPLAFTWLLERTPESAYGEASGAFTRAYGLGSLVGPLIAGLLVERLQYPGLLGLLAVAGLVVLVQVQFRDRALGGAVVTGVAR